MRSIVGFLFLLLFSSFLSAQGGNCTKVAKDDVTHWDGNELITYVRMKPRKQLKGKVVMLYDQLFQNALVEIYTNPQYLLVEPVKGIKGQTKQKRLFACRTGKDGKFSFPRLADGRYELRSSSKGGWNVTQIYVVVDRKSKKRSEMKVEMYIGT